MSNAPYWNTDFSLAPKDGTLVDFWCYWPDRKAYGRAANSVWAGEDWVISGRFFRGQHAHPPELVAWHVPPRGPHRMANID